MESPTQYPLFDAIAAVDINFGLAQNNKIPWYHPVDLQYFKDQTKHSIVIMGRKTWESIPIKHRPLKDRLNIIITKKTDHANQGTHYISDSLNTALKLARALQKDTKLQNYPIFVIGGAQVYAEAFNHPQLNQLFLTIIKKNYNCDLYLPNFDTRFKLIQTSVVHERKHDEITHIRFNIYKKTTSPPTVARQFVSQYKDIINDIILNGEQRETRNAPTISLFGKRIELNLTETDEFPLITSRNTPFRQIFEELMWILRGETNTQILQDKNTYIWNDNSTREFLDKQNLQHLPTNHIGPTYGYNMRHFNSTYPEETFQTDQLQQLLSKLKTNPTDRRLIISLWNPSTINQCALPPCVFLYQFYVNQSANIISLQVNIRSSDTPVALHWNIAHAALFLHLVAHHTQIYTPGKLIINLGDAHIYTPHINETKKMLESPMRPFPQLKFKTHKTSITDYQYEDLNLIEYNPEKPKLNLKMIA